MKHGNGFDKSGNKYTGDKMSTQALDEAKCWYESLLDAEFRGRKDTDGAARYRLAKKLGLKESILFRLQYRTAEMKDVAGEVYRVLQLGYQGLCERIERSAEAMESRKDATDKGHHSMGAGLGD